MSARGSQPPHIVHVVRSAGIGGLETHVIHLCKAAVARGYRVTVISLVTGRVQEGFPQSGAEVLCLGDRQEWSIRLLSALVRLVRTLRRLGPSLVHVHGIRPIVVGTVAARLARVSPVVCTLHASYALMAIDAAGRRRRSVVMVTKLLHYLGFALSDRILVDCEALGQEVADVYRGLARDPDRVRRQKVRLAYNSVDVNALDASEVRRDLRAHLNLGVNVVVYGTVSRLDEPKKGLTVLLEAFSMLGSDRQACHLVISGDGAARRLVERKADSLGVRDRVSFLGFYPHLTDVYRALDVFVLPSLTEGFPTVILEAMAFSLPAVVTDVGGCSEAVETGASGFVVPAADPRALGNAMGMLLMDGALRKAMGARGRARVVGTFSVPQLTAAVFRAYAELSEEFQAGKEEAGVRRR